MGTEHPLCVCCNYERRYLETRTPHTVTRQEISRVFAVGIGVGLALHHESGQTKHDVAANLCGPHRVAMHELYDDLAHPLLRQILGRTFPL